LKIAMREQGFPDDFIRNEIKRVKLDILIMLKPYMDFLKH